MASSANPPVSKKWWRRHGVQVNPTSLSRTHGTRRIKKQRMGGATCIETNLALVEQSKQVVPVTVDKRRSKSHHPSRYFKLSFLPSFPSISAFPISCSS